MFGSVILDVAIGLAMVYMFLSAICMTINEAIASWVELRAKTLEKALISMIDDKSLVDKIYNSPALLGLWQSDTQKKSTVTPLSSASEHAAGLETGAKQSGGASAMLRLPSYLPPKQFAYAVIDMIKTTKDAATKGIDDLEMAIEALPPGRFKDMLQSMASMVNGDVEKFQAAIEKWYDDCMDRVSGWYKRKIQIIGFIVALIVAVACNADTLEIAGRLYRDAALRSSVTATAADYVITLNQLGIGDLPIGWAGDHSFPTKPWDRVSKIVGWLFTAGALTIGAPLWFDVLKGLVNIRLAGRKPGEDKDARKKGADRVASNRGALKMQRRDT